MNVLFPVSLQKGYNGVKKGNYEEVMSEKTKEVPQLADATYAHTQSKLHNQKYLSKVLTNTR